MQLNVLMCLGKVGCLTGRVGLILAMDSLKHCTSLMSCKKNTLKDDLVGTSNREDSAWVRIVMVALCSGNSRTDMR